MNALEEMITLTEKHKKHICLTGMKHTFDLYDLEEKKKIS